ncbi:MAG: S41 family peptidase [Pirellulaceae bacterium]
MHITIIRLFGIVILLTLALALTFERASCDEPHATPRNIRLAQTPAVSPDGSLIAFSWLDEIWSAKLDGTDLRRLTHHAASDSQPIFSPDGSQIAFISDRTGSSQIFIMQSNGELPRQVTFHSAGYALADWFPDGNSLLAIGSRDHFWRGANRLIQVDINERRAEKILVDASADYAKLSHDGKRILLTREGERSWRKGYQGERAAQIWQFELANGKFTELLHEGVDCRWPVWMSDGRGFYFTRGDIHGFDLWRYRFNKNAEKPGKQKVVAQFDEDSIMFPAISRDGSTLVFRHLFDLYSFQPGTDQQPHKIQLSIERDVELPKDEMRREFSRADEVAFTADGLEIALIAGGDVWIMDTKLREPKRITTSSGYEEDLVFSPDGQSLYFTSIEDGQVDIWRAVRSDEDSYWWQNHEFKLERITNDMDVESELRFTANGKTIVMQHGRGNLVALNLEDKTKRTLVSGFSGIDYDLSSDGQWIAYAKQDNDFNSDVWLAPLSGDAKPVNVSRHPDNDSSPRFSPDGKLLAFTGRRIDQEVDVFYVYLNEEDDEETSRERTLKEAIELMQKKRKEDAGKSKEPKKESAQEKPSDPGKDGDQGDEKGDGTAESQEPTEPTAFTIDLEGIHERLRRISIPNSYEGSLLFSPDSEKLAFSATVDGKRGWYTVKFPSELTPKLLSTTTGQQAVWSERAGGILFLENGNPAKLDANGKLETYAFRVAQETSRSAWLKAGFDKAWLAMREAWYDERFANRNWDEIRRKYADMAAATTNPSELGQVVELMLGELNGSHLGFYPASDGPSSEVEGWGDETAHLGVRFVHDYQGPGLLVRDVIPDSPADREVSQLVAGDIILAIDGTPVDPAMDLTELLNGRLDRDILLRIQRKPHQEENGLADDDQRAVDEPEQLEISLRPISYARARGLLYDYWLEHNRRVVDQASQGSLGYLHIRSMDMTSFYDFETQLYNVGYGRDGLVIDVRDNGGGSTTDLLLTALTQPKHAVTIPRGGGQGYPHDRLVFASWSKPIIVLCNQNSYSNAEIFSHAIKTLARGKVVGVQTAGGVVSTGSASINDVGRIRIPFRGWFVLGTGKDMEMNGCLPDQVVWPAPGELPQGIDRQLDTAVRMLLEEVKVQAAKDTPEIEYATER